MSEAKLIRPVSPNTLPPELQENLRAFVTPDKYTMKDLVLAFIGKHEQATLDDLMIYIFEVRRRITTRGYLYQMIYRLRREGILRPVEKQAPHTEVYKLTVKGMEEAPAYLDPKTGEAE